MPKVTEWLKNTFTDNDFSADHPVNTGPTRDEEGAFAEAHDTNDHGRDAADFSKNWEIDSDGHYHERQPSPVDHFHDDASVSSSSFNRDGQDTIEREDRELDAVIAEFAGHREPTRDEEEAFAEAHDTNDHGRDAADFSKNWEIDSDGHYHERQPSPVEPFHDDVSMSSSSFNRDGRDTFDREDRELDAVITEFAGHREPTRDEEKAFAEAHDTNDHGRDAADFSKNWEIDSDGHFHERQPSPVEPFHDDVSMSSSSFNRDGRDTFDRENRELDAVIAEFAEFTQQHRREKPSREEEKAFSEAHESDEIADPKKLDTSGHHQTSGRYDERSRKRGREI